MKFDFLSARGCANYFLFSLSQAIQVDSSQISMVILRYPDGFLQTAIKSRPTTMWYLKVHMHSFDAKYD